MSGTTVPPGVCLTHGPHGMTVCPQCSTSAGPNTPPVTTRLNEITKCIVLCVDCHDRAHSQARRVESELRNPHGTVQRYWIGCKCDLCKRAKREYERDRLARRSS